MTFYIKSRLLTPSSRSDSHATPRIVFCPVSVQPVVLFFCSPMSRRDKPRRGVAEVPTDEAFQQAMAQLRANSKSSTYKDARLATARRQTEEVVVETTAEVDGPPTPADVAAVGPETQVDVVFTSRKLQTTASKLRAAGAKSSKIVFGTKADTKHVGAEPMMTFQLSKPSVAEDLKAGRCLLLPENLQLTLLCKQPQDFKVTAVGIKAMPGKRGYNEGDGWAYTIITAAELAPALGNGTAANVPVYSRPYTHGNAGLIRQYGAGVLLANFDQFHIVPQNSNYAYVMTDKSLLLRLYNTRGYAPLAKSRTELVAMPLAIFKKLEPECKASQQIWYGTIDLDTFHFTVEPVAPVDEHGVPLEAHFGAAYGATQPAGSVSNDRPVDMQILATLQCRICDITGTSAGADAEELEAEALDAEYDEDNGGDF